MKDLYKRLGFSGQVDDFGSLASAIRSQRSHETVRAARHILLDKRRKRVYDRNLRTMVLLGRLRANLGLHEAPRWTGSEYEDFKYAPDDFGPELERKRDQKTRASDSDVGVGWVIALILLILFAVYSVCSVYITSVWHAAPAHMVPEPASEVSTTQKPPTIHDHEPLGEELRAVTRESLFIAEFAKRIKEKYPEYKDWDNPELVRKVLVEIAGDPFAVRQGWGNAELVQKVLAKYLDPASKSQAFSSSDTVTVSRDIERLLAAMEQVSYRKQLLSPRQIQEPGSSSESVRLSRMNPDPIGTDPVRQQAKLSSALRTENLNSFTLALQRMKWTGAELNEMAHAAFSIHQTRGLSRDESIQEALRIKVQTFPPHGKIWSDVTANNRIAPFSVVTKAGTGYYFIKLMRWGTRQEILAAFVYGGRSFECNVPIGAYEMRYAVLQNWYGANRFGPEARIYRADKRLDFSLNGDNITGYTVELIIQEGGNLETEQIPPQEF